MFCRECLKNRKVNERQVKAKVISVKSEKIFISKDGDIFGARKRRQ